MSGSNRSAGNQTLAEQADRAERSQQSPNGDNTESEGPTGAITLPVEQSTRPDEPVKGQTQTQTEQPNAYGARDIVAQEAMADASIIMAIAALLTFFVTTAGTYLIWTQVKLTRKAVEDTGKATGAMERQNEIAETTAWQQLRAYIGVDSVRMLDDKPGFNWSFKNFGQSPAHKFSVTLLNAVGEEGQPFHELLWTWCKRFRTELPPGQVLHVAAHLTSDHIMAMRRCDLDGRAAYSKALISYSDAFGRRHFSICVVSSEPHQYGKGFAGMYDQSTERTRRLR